MTMPYFQCRDRKLDYSDRTLTMGVLNLTPDSFSDGGLWNSTDKAVQRAFQMRREGADIIDIGGESTRPGAQPVSEKEELRRVLPVVEALAGEADLVLSIDTYKPNAARRCLEAGAHIVNDISGLRDPEMIKTAARYGAGVIVMHMQGSPRTMQRRPVYNGVVSEIIRFLKRQTERALRGGVLPESLMADPGIGFGKLPLRHNLKILRRLRRFKKELPYPLMIGTSRKSFLGHILDGAPPNERLEGDAAAAAVAVSRGADAVRTHDVAFIAKTIRVADHICKKRAAHAD